MRFQFCNGKLWPRERDQHVVHQCIFFGSGQYQRQIQPQISFFSRLFKTSESLCVCVKPRYTSNCNNSCHDDAKYNRYTAVAMLLHENSGSVAVTGAENQRF